MATVAELESRFLRDPNVAGVSMLSKAPEWFTPPADEAPLGYWRRPDNRYVYLAQYGDNGTERKLERGHERLGALRYGSYPSAGTATWQPKDDPLYPLVVRGGLGELPGEQIKGLGWHRAPDRNARASHRKVAELVEQAMQARGISREAAVLAVMPQLEGIDLADYTCAMCPGRLFPTQASVLAHESVVHRDAVQSRSIGQAVAEAQGAGQRASAGAAGEPSGDAAALLSLIAGQGEVIAELKAQLAELRAERSAPKGKAAPKAAPKGGPTTAEAEPPVAE